MMMRSFCRSASTMVLATALACSLPTDFNADRDVLIAVADAVVTVGQGETEVSVPLDLRMVNRSSRPIVYIGTCGLAGLAGEGGVSFGISRPCLVGSGVETVQVEPGQEISVSLMAAAPREEWGPHVEGEYTLSLGLFVEPRDRAETVRSGPFRIDLAPEAGTE